MAGQFELCGVSRGRKKAGNTVEHRVATPRGDLFVLRLGKVKSNRRLAAAGEERCAHRQYDEGSS